MRKLTYSLFSLFLILLTTRCSQEELENKQDSPQKFLLKIEDARQIAKNLNLKNPYESKISEPSLRKTSNSIREESTISDGDLPNYYVFNYDNNSGFSIISADFRAMPVLAYSDNGNFTALNDTINSGLASYLEEYFTYIQSVRDSISYVSVDIANMWSDAGTASSLIPEPIDLCEIEPDIPCLPSDDDPFIPTTSTWGPLVQTQWNQNGGYNDSAPNLGCTGVDPRALTGCVATAMAQIMRYWEHPTNYTWSAMPNRIAAGTTNFHIANLMRDCGDAVDMDWGCDASSASTKDASKALEDDFGYSKDANFEDYLYYKTRDDIKSDRPVIVRACREREKKGFIITWYVYDGCHAWIADGLRVTNYQTYSHIPHITSI